MSDESSDTSVPIERRELLEERGNHDAFRIAIAIVALLFALGLVAVLHTSFVVIILPDRAPARQHAIDKLSVEFFPVGNMGVPLRRSTAAQGNSFHRGWTSNGGCVTSSAGGAILHAARGVQAE